MCDYGALTNALSYQERKVSKMGKTNIVAKLDGIAEYLEATRQMGHTSTMFYGVNNTEECVVVGSSQGNVDYLKRDAGASTKVGKKGIRYRTLNQVTLGRLRGTRLPMVLDNDALYNLCAEASGRIAELEEIIKKLKRRDDYVEACLT